METRLHKTHILPYRMAGHCEDVMMTSDNSCSDGDGSGSPIPPAPKRKKIASARYLRRWAGDVTVVIAGHHHNFLYCCSLLLCSHSIPSPSTCQSNPISSVESK